MGTITAVILAAGMGVRMGPRGKLTPKGLLTVGGATLIEQSVAALRNHGVARIVIVTGHLSEQYEAMYAGTDIVLAYNPVYATTGSLRSLAVGLEHVDGSCLILESDLIYAPQGLEQLDGRTNRFLVSTPTGAGDEQYVWTEPAPDGRHMLREISKNPAARSGPQLGEMIGLSQLDAQSVRLMRDVTRRELMREPEEHYEPGLVALSHDVPIECPLLVDLPWAEIDDETMLERAERLVYPRVAAARSALV